MKYLYDQDFLTQLALFPHKTQYARLKVFNKQGIPLQRLEGIITSGSIKVDGSAAIRRTCSLTLNLLDEYEIIDSYWALTHEFEVEIGLNNLIDMKYDPIVWFPMGHYLISSFSQNQTTNAKNVSVNGQDPITKLNGSCGGSFPHEIDFGITEVEQSDGSIIQEKEKIQTIIEQALQKYGKEEKHNILINDLPETGLELLEYRGKTPMYLIIKANADNTIDIVNYTLDQKVEVEVYEDGSKILISELEQYWSLGALDSNYNNNATKIKINNTDYHYVVKLEFGNTIGYLQTDLTYAGELILKAGDNVVSLLDKIKTMLGSFEYFYDVDGRFVFQKKKDYLQELFSPINGNIINPIAITSPYAYEFNDDKLIISKSIQPKIDNIKNDFVVWSKKSSLNGGQIDIHTRYAIDTKPTKYTSPYGKYEKISNLKLACRCLKLDSNYYLTCYNQEVYAGGNQLQITYTLENNNELIPSKYLDINNGKYFYIFMNNSTDNLNFTLNNNNLIGYQIIDDEQYIHLSALPYTLYYKDENTIYQSIKEDTELKLNNIYMYMGGGKTYVSYANNENIEDAFICDWREIIYQMAQDYEQNNQDPSFWIRIQRMNPDLLDGKTGYEQYYSDILGFWRNLYNPHDQLNCFGLIIDKETSQQSEQSYWNIQAYTHPEELLFWFDFLDTGESEIGQYNVRKIGMRQKIEHSKSNTNTNIFLPSTPEIIYQSPDSVTSSKDTTRGYEILQINEDIKKFFSTSSQGISVIEQTNNLIYDHSYCAETVSLSVIPMFWLQPNTRIYVKGIGDLIINTIAYSLTYNGMMTLSCTRVIENIF